MSLNQAVIIGHLGKDPESKKVGSETVTTFSVATSEKWTGKDGQKQERTEWHRVEVWGKQAETCAKYLAKGRLVAVTGKIQYDEWTDKDGKKRNLTKIRAANVGGVVFLGGGKEKEPAADDADEAPPF